MKLKEDAPEGAEDQPDLVLTPIGAGGAMKPGVESIYSRYFQTELTVW